MLVKLMKCGGKHFYEIKEIQRDLKKTGKTGKINFFIKYPTINK